MSNDINNYNLLKVLNSALQLNLDASIMALNVENISECIVLMV